MVRKGLLMLVLVVVAVGGVFAQANTIVVDVGPTIVGLAFGQAGNIAGNLMDGEMDLNSSGFGIAAQYERQVLRQLGIAARVAYMGVGFSMGEKFMDSGVSGNYSIGLDMKTVSMEGHARFYPAGNTFFLGGMVGYGNLMMDISGRVTATYNGQRQSEEVLVNAQRNYVKLGARLGWRIDFGRPGGFVFEPSFGYDHAFGLGDTFVKQLQNEVTGDIADINQLDDAFKILESYIFVGGPRVTLGFGWRF